ncbi:hypothetical protein ACWD25_15360 [Streptomyces sp. NPDC002920]
MWPFDIRLRAELAAVKADRERIRGERDQFAKDRDAFKYAAEKYTDTAIVNACLTEDLTKVREQLAASMAAESALARQIHEMAQPVEPTDSEMDEINRLHRELAAEKSRTDRLQKQLDDAFSLDHPTVADGATWQDRREQKMKYDA